MPAQQNHGAKAELLLEGYPELYSETRFQKEGRKKERFELQDVEMVSLVKYLPCKHKAPPLEPMGKAKHDSCL